MTQNPTATPEAIVTDHPHVRASSTCPICNRDDKDAGLLMCWPRYRATDARNQLRATFAKILDYAEIALQQEAK